MVVLIHHPLAPLEQILEGGLEIPCVPRVCNVAAGAFITNTKVIHHPKKGRAATLPGTLGRISSSQLEEPVVY